MLTHLIIRFFVADMEQQHGNMSWVDDAGLTGASSMTLYWAAVNFAMATVTTIGACVYGCVCVCVCVCVVCD